MICYRCKGELVVRNGLSKLGKQKYLCKSCNASLTEDKERKNVIKDDRKKMISEIKSILLSNQKSSYEFFQKKYKKSRTIIARILKDLKAEIKQEAWERD